MRAGTCAFDKSLLCAIGVAMFVTVNAGCAAKDPSDNGAASIDDLARVFCDAIRDCCAAAGKTTGLDECEVMFDPVFVPPALREAIASGAVVLHEPQFTNAFNAFASGARTCVFNSNESPWEGALSGTIPEGGGCTVADACARTNEPVACVWISASPQPPTAGVCRALERAQLGDECITDGGADLDRLFYVTNVTDISYAYCDYRDGLYCGLGQCAALLEVGDACRDPDACGPGHYCDETCQPLVQPGDACTDSVQCTPGRSCVEGVCEFPSLASDALCDGDSF